jgi:chemotaxis response regulator CheB
MSHPLSRDIVAIGASAGGVEAISRLLNVTPDPYCSSSMIRNVISA